MKRPKTIPITDEQDVRLETFIFKLNYTLPEDRYRPYTKQEVMAMALDQFMKVNK